MERVEANFLGQIFSSVKQIELEDSDLILYRDQEIEKISLSEIAGFVTVSRSIFGSRLRIPLNKKIMHIGLLRSELSLQIMSSSLNALLEVPLQSKLDALESRFYKKAINDYLKDSIVDSLEDLYSGVSGYLTTDYQSLSETTRKRLVSISSYFPVTQNLELIRTAYEQKILVERKTFFDGIEKNPLTIEQRLSVIRSNDRNLVLAGAGTGKTSVIVSKALNLIDDGSANPEDILILAFGNAAAEELRERIAERAIAAKISKDLLPEIRTFHALGRDISRSVRGSMSVSKFAEDSHSFYRWVTSWLETRILSSPKAMRDFLQLLYIPYNEFDFKSVEEYQAFLRDNPFRTLRGELVKSGQELEIANWFYLNGIAYQYENRYLTKRRFDPGEDYKPDFDLGNGLYLEHFGVDREGKTRVGIDSTNYQKGMEWKRALHKEHNTTLIETYSYEGFEGILEQRLEELMLLNDIEISPIPPEETFKVLQSEGIITEKARLLRKCLQAVRVDGIDLNDVERRMRNHKVSNEKLWAKFISDLVGDYVSELQNQKKIDFDDMILLATDDIANSDYVPSWKHVLVDEFQDISQARMALTKAIIDSPSCETFTAVGDDWQAIYRFSGGRLTLTTRFSEAVGSYTESKLQKTFRYNDSIADVAGSFVMQNPEQIEKDIKTQAKTESPQIYLLDDYVNEQCDPSEKLLQVIKTIRANDPDGSISIIARYNFLLDDPLQAVRNAKLNKQVRYWTFHSSKGLEADYAVLIGLNGGGYGFPSMRINEAPLEALLPETDGFLFSEERRLFYVGLTRARFKCYLIANPFSKSMFVNELLNTNYSIEIASKKFEAANNESLKCPRCSGGFFERRQGSYGDFYACSTGIACDVKANICPACDAPLIDTLSKRSCNNTKCAHTEKLCRQCGRPMRLRTGSFGSFWGCSGYGDPDDQCTYKEKV